MKVSFDEIYNFWYLLHSGNDEEEDDEITFPKKLYQDYDYLIPIKKMSNCHLTAHQYIFDLESRYLDFQFFFYNHIQILIGLVDFRTSTHEEGFENAMNIYINHMYYYDEEAFILVNFLEYFYIYYSFFISETYTRETHEEIFKKGIKMVSKCFEANSEIYYELLN